MGNEPLISLRLPESLLARVLALRNVLATDAGVAATLSRSDLLRLALERGVEAIEASAKPKPRKR